MIPFKQQKCSLYIKRCILDLICSFFHKSYSEVMHDLEDVEKNPYKIFSDAFIFFISKKL